MTSLTPIDSERSVERLVADAEAAQRAGRGLPARLAAVTGTATDRHGMITVRTGPSGALIGLVLHPNTTQADPTQLGKRIVEVAEQAARDARQRGFNLLAQVVGDGGMALVEDGDGPAPARDPGWAPSAGSTDRFDRHGTDRFDRDGTDQVDQDDENYVFDAWGRPRPAHWAVRP
jgi:hypothetical protein